MIWLMGRASRSWAEIELRHGLAVKLRLVRGDLDILETDFDDILAAIEILEAAEELRG